MSEPAAAKEISDRLTYAIDAILDEGLYAGRIHVLAYSFGSIVVVDDLAPPTGTSVVGTQRVANAIIPSSQSDAPTISSVIPADVLR